MKRPTVFRTALVALTALGATLSIAGAVPLPSSVSWVSLDVNSDTQPQAVALSPDGLRAYTANYYTGTVSVIDTETGTVLAPVIVGLGTMHGIVVNHAGTRAYVTMDSSVETIDLTSDPAVRVGTLADVGTTLGAIAISPDDATLYVAENSGSQSVAKIAVGTGTVTQGGAIANDIQQMAITPDGTGLYATTWAHGLIPIATADLSPGTPINVGGANLNGVAIDPAGTDVYAVAEDGPCGAGAGCLKVVSLPSLAVSDINIGGHAYSVAVSGDGSTLFAGLTSGEVMSLPADDSAFAEVMTTGVGGAKGIAVDPGGASVYVTSYNTGPDGCDYSNPPAPECYSGTFFTLRFPAPAAPTGLSATAGDGSATIAFVPGDANGTTVTNTEYSLGGGPWVAAAPATPTGPVVITGLVNGTTYSVRLRSRSGTVAGPRSEPVLVTPAAPPPAPVPSDGSGGGGPEATTPAASSVVPPSHPTPPLAPPRTARVEPSGDYVTVGVVPDGATSVVQSASRGAAASSAKQALARGVARTRVRTGCPITSRSGTRTYHCSIHLGRGTWVVTTRAMNGATVVASSTRAIRVTTRAHRAVTG